MESSDTWQLKIEAEKALPQTKVRDDVKRLGVAWRSVACLYSRSKDGRCR